jgi:hypothetical protein
VIHPETQIRQTVAQLLTDANTVAQDRVFRSRTTHQRRVELPAIAIYTLSTESEVADEAPRTIRHASALAVELRLDAATAPDYVDDSMDVFRLQVEDVLNYNRDLIPDTEDLTPVGTELGFESSGERVTAVALMSYVVVYRSSAQPSGTDSLTSVEATYNLGNAQDPGNQRQDLIPLEGAV